jgi:hypothetical protein
MKFLTHLFGINKSDRGRKQPVRGKLGVQNNVQEIEQNKKKWLQHLQGMDSNRLPKQAL